MGVSCVLVICGIKRMFSEVVSVCNKLYMAFKVVGLFLVMLVRCGGDLVPFFIECFWWTLLCFGGLGESVLREPVAYKLCRCLDSGVIKVKVGLQGTCVKMNSNERENGVNTLLRWDRHIVSVLYYSLNFTPQVICLFVSCLTHVGQFVYVWRSACKYCV
jgi:hypothetical protein